MNSRLISVFLFTGILLFTACNKEGPEGDASIRATVRHNNHLIPNAEVHLSYGSTTEPGTEAGNYDVTKTADSIGIAIFTNLKEGSYYVYASGTDTVGVDVDVSGGIAVQITKAVQILEVE
ncbi:MAG: hypothetical protein IH946_11085, partial [Bacteroidetes bacterium]|nr:hypothetical protein [Bacteroidota bacterium]